MGLPSNRVWHFALLLGVVVILLLGFSRAGRRASSGAVSPFVAGCHGVCGYFRELWQNLFPDGEAQELQRCRLRLSELEVQQGEYQQLLEENRQLSALAGVQPRDGWHAVATRVTLRDPAAWNWLCQIDLGSADGVVAGAPLLAGSSLAGRVSEVYRHHSMVRLLSNPECVVSVFVHGRDGKYPGVLRGHASPNGVMLSAEVDFLPKEALIMEGDMVTTSGLGIELPGGIKVGSIEAGSYLVDDARRAAVVRLSGNLKQLDFLCLFLKQQN